MKKNFIVMAIALLMAGTNAMADDYSYLTVKKNDTAGTETSTALSTLKKITFSSGNMVLTTTSGTVSYTLTELDKMYFASTATGISNITDIDNCGALNVYSTNGVKMAEYAPGTSVANINLSNMPKGVYIVKCDGKTIKVTNN